MSDRPHDYIEQLGDSLAMDAEAVEQKMRAYRAVFSSPDGEWVLSDLLSALGFLDSNVESEAGQALQNFARGHLLFWLGIWHEENKEEITRALLTIQISRPERGATQ